MPRDFTVFSRNYLLKPEGHDPYMAPPKKYTCIDYRTEMILLGLTKRLHENDLNKDEEEKIRSQIKEIEKEMEID